MAELTPAAIPSRAGQRQFGLPAFAGALIVLTALRVYVAARAGLTDDEAYYRLWSIAPALSYLDHPPMVAWLIGCGRYLAGDTALGVRFCAPFLMALGTVVLWRTAALLFDNRIAARAAWLLLAMPLLAVGGVIVTPDLPSVLFSGLVIWALAELDRSQDANWWLAVGLFAGLGLLSKYTNLFLGATILIWLLAVPSNRRWLRAPQLWLGGLIAVALASPVVIWNSEHEWASFAKQFGRVAKSGDGVPGVYVAEMVGGFVALANPLVAVLAAIGLYVVSRRALRTRASADALLVAAIAPMFCYFAFHALHNRVQANWLAPLYPPLAIGAAIAVDKIQRASLRRAITVAAIAAGFVMSAAIYRHALVPISGVTLHKDPTAQMRGWSEFALEVDRLREASGARWIATSSYATTGQLAFALKDRSSVAQLNERIRYINLPPIADEILRHPALYVELERRSDPAMLKAKFASVGEVASLVRRDGSPAGASYSAYLLADPIGPPLTELSGDGVPDRGGPRLRSAISGPPVR